MVNFNERLIACMKENGFTCAALARALGTDKERLHNWVKGKNYPQLYYFDKLCKVLEVSADYLLTGKEQENGNTGAVHNCTSHNGPCDCHGVGDTCGDQVPKNGKGVKSTSKGFKHSQKDYFEFEDAPENEDTKIHYEHEPRTSIGDMINYEREFINKLLNKPTLEEADKYIISGIVESICFNLYTLNESAKSFDEFTEQVMGREWHDNIMAKWLQRMNNAFAEKVGCPELMNNKGIYLVMPGEEEE